MCNLHFKFWVCKLRTNKIIFFTKSNFCWRMQKMIFKLLPLLFFSVLFFSILFMFCLFLTEKCADHFFPCKTSRRQKTNGRVNKETDRRTDVEERQSEKRKERNFRLALTWCRRQKVWGPASERALHFFSRENIFFDFVVPILANRRSLSDLRGFQFDRFYTLSLSLICGTFSQAPFRLSSRKKTPSFSGLALNSSQQAFTIQHNCLIVRPLSIAISTKQQQQHKKYSLTQIFFAHLVSDWTFIREQLTKKNFCRKTKTFKKFSK